MEPNEDAVHATPDPSTESTTSSAAEPSSVPEAAATGKPDAGKRFIALFIDGIIAAIIFWLLFAFLGIYAGAILGLIIAGGYMIVRDGLTVEFMNGRSIGKKLMKLRPVRLDGSPMDLEASIKRNWMFGISYFGSVTFLGVIGSLIGLVATVVILYECYKVLTDTGGRRWGDELAGTRVIESAD